MPCLQVMNADGDILNESLLPEVRCLLFTARRRPHTTDAPAKRALILIQRIPTPPPSSSQVPDEELVRWYKLMVKQNQMDNILYESQRQGRISFYMTSFGEEATHIGSAACLSNEDVIYAQYRETGVLLYRGYGLDEVRDEAGSGGFFRR